MKSTCIYDRDDECCYECPECPRSIKEDVDPDILFEYYINEKYNKDNDGSL